MARIRYGRTFTTRRGKRGRYKYVNGRRVSFVHTSPTGVFRMRKGGKWGKALPRYRRYRRRY